MNGKRTIEAWREGMRRPSCCDGLLPACRFVSRRSVRPSLESSNVKQRTKVKARSGEGVCSRYGKYEEFPLVPRSSSPSSCSRIDDSRVDRSNENRLNGRGGPPTRKNPG